MTINLGFRRLFVTWKHVAVVVGGLAAGVILVMFGHDAAGAALGTGTVTGTFALLRPAS